MLVENCQFELTSLLFGAPNGVTLVEFRCDFWLQKTRISALSYDLVCAIIRLAALVLLACDGQMDRQTDG